MTQDPLWTRRLWITSHAVHGALLLVAAAGAVLLNGPTTSTLTAIGLASLGAVLSVSLRIPFDSPSRRPIGQLGASIALYAGAMALAGGIVSTFTLLPIAAIFLAAAGGGYRFAVPTAFASIAGILAATWLAGAPADPTSFIRVPAMYLLIALTFSEVRRAVMTETDRADRLMLATDAAHTRGTRLSATNELLTDLVAVAQSPDINAVTTAQDAIRDVGLIVSEAPCRIVTSNDIVLARRGADQHHPSARRFPIMCSGDEVGHLELWEGDRRLGNPEVTAIARAIEPVGIAIDNDALLQRLAGVTIQRERVRLARDLHDDVAPSIAAVGLALDMALMSGDLNDEQVRNLSATRSSVSRLVDQIRNRVEDLRADRTLSIVEMAHALVAEVDADGPTVIINIDERTPPRPAMAVELGGFMTEAFRNAVDHADATAIWVTGRITDHDGFLAVQDNGRGFDPDSSSDAHFGIVGMRERAAILSATFELDATIGEGTVISLNWKDAL